MDQSPISKEESSALCPKNLTANIPETTQLHYHIRIYYLHNQLLDSVGDSEDDDEFLVW
ncbi:3219_t:CDS:2 [Funneliformis mosseae]|uniref:3219_t:CDS:1 n=1 Tax=Funneliformis mosseae TaxID=27381 RepID=A0A9N9F2S2_FUNMO|nr:3219_t:CDS:2 [Funneliformis mosseae]